MLEDFGDSLIELEVLSSTFCRNEANLAVRADTKSKKCE